MNRRINLFLVANLHPALSAVGCFISPLFCPFFLTHIGKFLLLLILRPPPFWLQSLNFSLKAPRL